MNKTYILPAVVMIIGLVAIGGYFLYPNSYIMSGAIMNEEEVPLTNVNIQIGDTKTKSNELGEYTINTDGKTSTLLVSTDDANYLPVQQGLDFSQAKRKGFKTYQINADVTLAYNIAGFVEDVLTNQKFSRHNLIWSQLDQPSLDVFGSQDMYEKFFQALFHYASGANIKSFTVRDDEITKRETWTSAQGVEYSSVYEVPVEKEFNDGTSDSGVFYVVVVNGTLKTTSGYDQAKYEEVRQILVDAGYLSTAE